MSKSLNFNNVKKHYLTITLADEKNTVLMIGTPTKAIMDDITLLQESMTDINENNVSDEATDDIYRACAKIMSRNRAGVEITTEFLSELFDFEDIIIFFNAYMDFISEIANSKN